MGLEAGSQFVLCPRSIRKVRPALRCPVSAEQSPWGALCDAGAGHSSLVGLCTLSKLLSSGFWGKLYPTTLGYSVWHCFSRPQTLPA